MRMQMIDASLHSGDIRRRYHVEAFTGLMELNVLYRERSVAIHMLRRRYDNLVRRLAMFRHTPQLIGNPDVLSVIIRLFMESW